MRVKNIREAWNLADRLFPSDYQLDESRTANAGYKVYYSTDPQMHAWISDLGNRLELNYSDGKFENIWIDCYETSASVNPKLHPLFEALEDRNFSDGNFDFKMRLIGEMMCWIPDVPVMKLLILHDLAYNWQEMREGDLFEHNLTEMLNRISVTVPER